jgi:hypothetical protein
MPLALLVTLVGVTLSAGLSGVVVGQIKESQRAADRVAAVTAAQAGLDAGLARIRSSMTALSGDLTKLPCTVITDTLTPRAGSGTATAAYRLSIGYFLVDPSGLTNTLRPVGDLTNLSQPLDALLNGVGQSLTTAAKASLTSAVQGAVGCVNGVVKQVPLYGLLRSTGTVGDTTRTLYATYTFHTTEETIPGGHIVIAGTNGQLCLGGGIRADGKAPQSGDPVLAVPCTGADEQIKFIYPRNLNLSLSKSRTTKQAGAPYGMCVTAAVQVDNAPVTFAPCVSPKAVSQQWSYEVNQQTYYGTLNGTTSSTYCLTMSQAGVVNSPIVLKRNNSNCGTSGRAYKAFVPEASVGSGAAGINTGQLVNFQEVGRCLDLTEEDPKGGYFTSRKAAPALITYPCKQSFDGKVFWNHAWRSPVIPAGEYLAKGQISTVPDKGTYAGIPYCLNSPGAAGGYVWVEPCSTGTPALEWTVYGPAPLATEAYQVVDMYGNCLQAAGSLGSAHQYKGWSLVIATACNGSGVQKWNKPNSLGLGPLTGIQER